MRLAHGIAAFTGPRAWSQALAFARDDALKVNPEVSLVLVEVHEDEWLVAIISPAEVH